MNRSLAWLLCLCFLGGVLWGQDWEFVTVPKAVGYNWFNRMEEGVMRFDKDYPDIEAFQQGPSKFDAALQVQVLEDLIARGVDVITVVPFQPETLGPVLAKARAQGIVVISHEAPDLREMDYDIEAFDNGDYGRFLMDELARRMGKRGSYATFVGSLSSTSHMEWVNAAVEYQKKTYPAMKMVGTINETSDDVRTAYNKTRELLRAYPDLRGVHGSSAVDVVGAGQAIEEAGLEDKISVVGTSIVSFSGELLKTGAVDLITAWDPADAGYVMNVVGKMVKEGKKIKDGMDLGVPGYDKIRLVGNVIYGSSWVKITKDNMKDYNY